MVATIIKQKPKAQGYIKDLAYLKLAIGFFKTAIDDLLKDEELFTSTKKENQNKKTNQRITRRLEEYLNQRDIVFSNVNRSDRNKANKYADKLLVDFMRIAPKTISMNLELIAIYLIWCRFKEVRQKPLHVDFNYFANSKRLFDLAGLICTVDISDETAEYKLAYKLTKVL